MAEGVASSVTVVSRLLPSARCSHNTRKLLQENHGVRTREIRLRSCLSLGFVFAREVLLPDFAAPAVARIFGPGVIPRKEPANRAASAAKRPLSVSFAHGGSIATEIRSRRRFLSTAGFASRSRRFPPFDRHRWSRSRRRDSRSLSLSHTTPLVNSPPAYLSLKPT
jgi:hypothetical protein